MKFAGGGIVKEWKLLVASAVAFGSGLIGDRSEPSSIACFVSAGFCLGIWLCTYVDRKFDGGTK